MDNYILNQFSSAQQASDPVLSGSASIQKRRANFAETRQAAADEFRKNLMGINIADEDKDIAAKLFQDGKSMEDIERYIGVAQTDLETKKEAEKYQGLNWLGEYGKEWLKTAGNFGITAGVTVGQSIGNAGIAGSQLGNAVKSNLGVATPAEQSQLEAAGNAQKWWNETLGDVALIGGGTVGEDTKFTTGREADGSIPSAGANALASLGVAADVATLGLPAKGARPLRASINEGLPTGSALGRDITDARGTKQFANEQQTNLALQAGQKAEDQVNMTNAQLEEAVLQGSRDTLRQGALEARTLIDDADTKIAANTEELNRIKAGFAAQTADDLPDSVVDVTTPSNTHPAIVRRDSEGLLKEQDELITGKHPAAAGYEANLDAANDIAGEVLRKAAGKGSDATKVVENVAKLNNFAEQLVRAEDVGALIETAAGQAFAKDTAKWATNLGQLQKKIQGSGISASDKAIALKALDVQSDVRRLIQQPTNAARQRALKNTVAELNQLSAKYKGGKAYEPLTPGGRPKSGKNDVIPADQRAFNPVAAEARIKELTKENEALAASKGQLASSVEEGFSTKFEGVTVQELADTRADILSGKDPRVRQLMPDARTVDDIVAITGKGKMEYVDTRMDLVARNENQIERLMPQSSRVAAEESMGRFLQERQQQILADESIKDPAKEMQKITQDAQATVTKVPVNDADRKIMALRDENAELNAELDGVVQAFNQFKNEGRITVVDPEKQAKALNQVDKQEMLHGAGDSGTRSAITHQALTDAGDDVQDFQAYLRNDRAVEEAVRQQAEEAALMASDVNPESGLYKSVSWLDTPLDRLRKMGTWGKWAADKYEAAAGSFAVNRGEFSNWFMDVKNEYKAFKGPRREEIVKFLDGQVDASALNADELVFASKIRQYFQGTADRLGLPKDARVSEYLPHLFEAQYGKLYENIQKDIAELTSGIKARGKDAGRELSNKEKIKLAKRIDKSPLSPETIEMLRKNNSWQVKDGFLNKRTGAEGYSQDLMKVLDTYDLWANKKIVYEPVLREISDSAAYIEDAAQKAFIAKFNSKILHAETPTALDKTGSVYRRFSNLALMGLSPLTAVKNLSVLTNIAADRGVINTIVHMPEAFKVLKNSGKLAREMRAMGINEGQTESFLRGMLREWDTTKTGRAMSAFENVEKFGWSMIRGTDQYTRAINYLAAKDEFIKLNPEMFVKGNPVDDVAQAALLKHVQKANRNTVFTFDDVDIPIGLNNAVGKLFANLQTYNLQQAKYLGKLIGGDEKSMFVKTKDGYKMSPEGLKRVVVASTTFAAFAFSMSEALGIEWYELTPFGEQVKYAFDVGTGNGEDAQLSFPSSPIVGAIFGTPYNDSLLTQANNWTSAVASGDEEALGKANDAFVKTGLGLVPFSAQTRRTVGGIESVQQGYAESSYGNLQFKQNQDIGNAFIAAVFGKNRTQAGRDWRESGANSVPSSITAKGTAAVNGGEDMKMSEYIKSLPSYRQKQYIDFYTQRETVLSNASKMFGKSRSDLVKELNGDGISFAQASAEAEKWNRAVAEELQGYMSTQETDVPHRITDDIDNNLFIEVTPPADRRAESTKTKLRYTDYLVNDFN